MHELHAADKILHRVVDFGTDKLLNKITAIYIDLGSVVEHGEEIKPEMLRYNFNNLSRATIAEGAKLHINRIKGDTIKIKEIEGE